ncbi:MAG: hypothetical protein AAFQ82_20260 [Myxococcota bacterium]
MKRVLTFGAALAAVLGLASQAWSYLPPAIQILENMSAKRAKLRLADVTAQLTAEIDGVEQPVEERIYLKSPERVRLVQEKPEGTELYVEREGKRAAGAETALKTLKGPSVDMLAQLLMPRGESSGDKANRLIVLLKNAGVDTRTVTLGVYGDDVRETAFIIGAKPWEDDKAQLWIDRERHQPVRWVTFVEEGGQRVRYESRFTGYGSPSGGAWFPETIEILRAGERVRLSQLNEIRTNERLPESLFELP